MILKFYGGATQRWFYKSQILDCEVRQLELSRKDIEGWLKAAETSGVLLLLSIEEDESWNEYLDALEFPFQAKQILYTRNDGESGGAVLTDREAYLCDDEGNTVNVLA